MIGASGSRHLARRRGSSPAVNPLLAAAAAAAASSARRLSTQREENESDLESGGGGGRRKASMADSSDGRRESRVSSSGSCFLFMKEEFPATAEFAVLKFASAARLLWRAVKSFGAAPPPPQAKQKREIFCVLQFLNLFLLNSLLILHSVSGSTRLTGLNYLSTAACRLFSSADEVGDEHGEYGASKWRRRLCDSVDHRRRSLSPPVANVHWHTGRRRLSAAARNADAPTTQGRRDIRPASLRPAALPTQGHEVGGHCVSAPPLYILFYLPTLFLV